LAIGEQGGREPSAMEFRLIDRILELEPGQRILAVKNLTLAEQYLHDHFPGFPVMPGVLMLEAMIQAGAWLLRETLPEPKSIIRLRSVRAVRYGSFVRPGDQLVVAVELKKLADQAAQFSGKGKVNEAVAVSGRFALTAYNVADRRPELAELDQNLLQCLRREYLRLTR